MIVYEGTKKDFQTNVEENNIAEIIEKKILEVLGRHTPKGEFKSWIHSLDNMYKVINDSEIPENVGIAIEYNVPLTAKRVDFMISGYDENNEPGMIIIELKQWQELKKVEKSKKLVETFLNGAMRKVVHPSYQAWSYKQLIYDYNSTVQDSNVFLKPCAYLHNYERKSNDPIDDTQYNKFTSLAPAFTKGEIEKLRSFIKQFVKKGDNKDVLYLVDHGIIRPSKSLQDVVASMIENNEEFIMIDEQCVVYEEILRIFEQCQSDNKKRTVICKGGPGTGKSVIAIRLLAELTARGQTVQYVSKNSAPRDVYSERLKGVKGEDEIDNMFKGSGSYIDTPNNTFGMLIADEAHRLNEKSGLFSNKGENQMKEIIHASLCSVFFIDENQRVTMADKGSIEEIKTQANTEGSEVAELKLVSQFRCNGSNGFLAWVDDVLEINETANITLKNVNYEFNVCNSPDELRDIIVEKNRINNRSRIFAGYCWAWPKKTRTQTNYHDIKIGSFEISWNLDNGQAFALDENSINEAGCIHTAQGLDFDYVGVIIGDDMRFENGHIVTDCSKRAPRDKSIKGLKKLFKEDPETAKIREDEIIKNTYRTLMTRGLKGCYIYCTDRALQNYLRKRMTNP